jgi:hypothetical protein
MVCKTIPFSKISGTQINRYARRSTVIVFGLGTPASPQLLVATTLLGLKRHKMVQGPGDAIIERALDLARQQ